MTHSTIDVPSSEEKPQRIPSPLLFALLPAFLSFVLYWITCSPTINFTDSGELVSVAWTSGIAHPPGYPLYSLLSSLAIALPFGEAAWRVNMVSALFAAVSVGLFYCLVAGTLLGLPVERGSGGSGSNRSGGAGNRSGPAGAASRKRGTTQAAAQAQARAQGSTAVRYGDEGSLGVWAATGGGLAASGLLAVSLTFWNWATQAKFYTLHYAFVAALLWLAISTRRALLAEAVGDRTPGSRFRIRDFPRGIKLLHGLVFVLGLSLTNHFLTFLLVPGLLLLLLTPLSRARDILRRVVPYTGTLLLTGLLPILLYVLLPLRAAGQPVIGWGQPDNLGNFWRHITAQSYQGFFGAANLGNNMADAFVYAANQFSPLLGLLLLAPIVVGVMHLWRADRGLLAATSLIALVHLLVVLNYNIREIVTYYVPLYMIALFWAGIGVGQGIRWVMERRNAPSGQAGRGLAVEPIAALGVGLLLPAIALLINWGAAGHRDNYTAELFVRNAFKNFQPDAVVVTNYWDLTSATFYLQHVLNERRDVALIDKSLLKQPFYVEYLEREHSEMMSKVAGPLAEYKAQLEQWHGSGTQPAGLVQVYLGLLNALIETNLGERPVYANFVVAADDLQEQQEARALLESRQALLVPDGYGLRIASGPDDMQAHDPQFDLRGITSERVPLDEIEAAVVALYPSSLRDIGNYLMRSTPEDQQTGTRLLAQAQELDYLAQWLDARPRLR